MPNSISELHHAAVNGHLDEVRKILADGVDVDSRRGNQESALQLVVGSCRNNRVPMTTLLLSEGASVNAKGYHDRSALMEAVVRLAHETSTVALNPASKFESGSEGEAYVGELRNSIPQSAAIVRLLLDEKADPNSADANGMTPLHEAAAGGLSTVVRWLIDAGAGVNARNKRGETPIAIAKSFQHHKVIEILKAAASSTESDRPSWWRSIFG